MKPRQYIKRTAIRKRPPRKKSPKQKESALQRKKANGYSVYWRDRCDTFFAKLIKTLAGNKCEKCGSKTRLLNTHHLIRRERAMTRCEIPNGICLCSICHSLGRDAAHSTTGSWQFIAWLEKKYPEKWKWMQAHGNDKGRVDWKEKLDELEVYMTLRLSPPKQS